MRVLFVGGDVGGCRALEPVVQEASKRGYDVSLADHGFWKGKDPRNISDDKAVEMVKSGTVDVFSFSTSVKDVFPLYLARCCRERNIPALCMLDSWVNFRWRLELDGNGLFLPDRYAVMDREAFDDAVAEGLPEDILSVTGQPAFASLAPLPEVFNSDGRRIVLFASEPVEMDRGGDKSFPEYCGYTEKIVFPLFCRALQEYSGQIYLLVAPHPREDVSVLEQLWQEHRGSLEGRILAPGEGRKAFLSAFAVAGMASILLYEAWLLGIPVLSLQPNLIQKDMAFILRRNGVFGTVDEIMIPSTVASWFEAASQGRSSARPELERHRSAASRCADLLEFLYVSKRGGFEL